MAPGVGFFFLETCSQARLLMVVYQQNELGSESDLSKNQRSWVRDWHSVCYGQNAQLQTKTCVCPYPIVSL